MWKFFYQVSKKIWVPAGWTLLTIVLLCLPGSALPGVKLFNIPHFDKVAHIILFGGIVFFWVFYYEQIQFPDSGNVLIIILLSISLGVIMEFVQFNFIPNRSFDLGDIAANAGGSVLAGFVNYYLLRKMKYKKMAPVETGAVTKTNCL